MNGWYSPLLALFKTFGLLALAGTVARAFIAFAAWRTAFRNRLLGVEPREQEVS